MKIFFTVENKIHGLKLKFCFEDRKVETTFIAGLRRATETYVRRRLITVADSLLRDQVSAAVGSGAFFLLI